MSGPARRARRLADRHHSALLAALGVGRGLAAKRSVARATLETHVAAAAVAGVAMGRLLS